MSGITEHAVADLFDYIHMHNDREFVLKFSAIEIYNEAVKDFLSLASGPLRLLDDPERGTIVKKLTEEILRDWDHLKELLSFCEAQRQIGETSLNETSSRSHQILRLVQLQHKIKQEAEQFRQWKASHEKELLQLRKEGRRNQYEQHKLQALNQHQKMENKQGLLLNCSTFALLFERKVRPRMTTSVFLKIMLLGLLEPVIDQNLFYTGMKYTTATFATAMCNIVPAMFLLMAWILS
ncbi:kinesin-like protein KIN-4C [Camellia sinensis]|uniref:kinesin-like protein KIN-4C n=1 Tax=Camellia sinensis TaxID=4442 RepID=UPI00103581DF|nr:kinesin-like protein KIN-4C [Camellia sinensis]